MFKKFMKEIIDILNHYTHRNDIFRDDLVFIEQIDRISINDKNEVYIDFSGEDCAQGYESGTTGFIILPIEFMNWNKEEWEKYEESIIEKRRLEREENNRKLEESIKEKEKQEYKVYLRLRDKFADKGIYEI
jgi:hypothetical protein